MLSAITLARPYARAAYELACEHDALQTWAAKLGFAAHIAADARVSALFGDPRAPVDRLAAVVLPEGEDTDSLFARFVQTLADNGRLMVLPEIDALFNEFKNEAERVLHVKVRSATPIGADGVARLAEALKRRFGRAIEMEQSIDPTLLGGAIIDAGNVVIDGSVDGRLARLEQALAY